MAISYGKEKALDRYRGSRFAETWGRYKLGMISALLGLAACSKPVIAPLPDPPAPMNREFRAAWIATVDNIDWPSRPGLPTERAQHDLLVILDRAKSLGLNAVVLQVRPQADAFYFSEIEPWSEYLTGQQGRKPNPYWDPLAFAIEEAHKRGLELHAWFNPYRAWHPAAKGTKAANYIGNTAPEIVKTYGTYEWMDPAEPAVQERSLKVMLDVVKRYDLDGVHIDDYFYPYKVRDAKGQNVDFPDSRSWSRYKASPQNLLSRGDWRRKHVDDFIERLYKAIKDEKIWVKFGISPFGIYRPGVPDGIKAGVDQYADLYADARKWLREGWVDYYTPQLYWPVNQTPQAYPVLLKWWVGENVKERHIWPGNYTGRTDPGNGNWKSQEVVDQIEHTRKAGAGGNVHFSMKSLMRNWNGISDALKSGPYATPALVPASPWLDKDAPEAPVAEAASRDSVSWKPGGEVVRFYAVHGFVNGSWKLMRVGSDNSISPGAYSHLSITPIDRVGNAGTSWVVEIP